MTVLGLDWGERRIGVAVSDPMGIIALPLVTLDVVSEEDAIAQIKPILIEKECDEIVVGMPFNMNGTKGPVHAKADAFLDKLAQAVDIRVSGWDERMSSVAADRALDEAQMDSRAKKGVRDRVAAQIILQSYLDSNVGHATI